MIGSFALLLVVFGLVIDALIEYTLVREFDFYLETVARTLAAAVEAGGGHIEVKLVPEALPDIQQVEGELFSQYWTDDGATLAKSRNLADHSLPRFSGKDGQPEVQTLVLPDGRNARAVGMRFPIRRNTQISEGSPPELRDKFLTLVVTRDTTDLESHVRQLRWLLLAAGIGAMTVGTAVSVVVIRRTLRPLHQVAANIATIKEDDLSPRESLWRCCPWRSFPSWSGSTSCFTGWMRHSLGSDPSLRTSPTNCHPSGGHSFYGRRHAVSRPFSSRLPRGPGRCPGNRPADAVHDRGTC